MYQEILLDLLSRSIAEITKINADLADTGRMMKADAARADEITAGVKHANHHVEFSAFTGRQGRV